MEICVLENTVKLSNTALTIALMDVSLVYDDDFLEKKLCGRKASLVCAVSPAPPSENVIHDRKLLV